MHKKNSGYLGDFSEQERTVDVRLHEDTLNNSGTFVGKVEGDALTTDNLIGRIMKSGAAINPHVLKTAAMYLDYEIKKAFAEGHKVEVLGVGVLRLALDGTVKNVRGTPSTLPHLEARFSLSDDVKKLAKNVRINDMVVSDNKPRIFDILGFDSNSVRVEAATENGVEAFSSEPGANHDLRQYNRSYPINVDVEMILNSSDDKVAVVRRLERVTLKGQHIKIAGDGSDIFFASMSKDGILADEANWISLNTAASVRENLPSTVSFYVPKDIPDGHYRIVLKTKYNKSGKLMKNLAQAVSCEVIVAGIFSLE